MANQRNAKKPAAVNPSTGKPVVKRRRAKGSLSSVAANKNAQKRKSQAAAKKVALQAQQEEMRPVIDELAEQLGIVVNDVGAAASSVVAAVAPAEKKRAPRKKTEPCAKSRVVKVTFTSPDAKTKRRKYRALCANGGTRLITRAQYAAYAARDGVEARPLPALRKKKSSKKASSLPKRSDVGAYCNAYGETYQQKCMRLLKNPEACASVGAARREYCIGEQGKTRVSRVRRCASIAKATKTRALNKKLSEEEAEKRAKASAKNCRRKRSARNKPVTKGRYTVTDEPRRRKPKAA